MDFWLLPGPHNYLERVLKALRDGFSVIGALPGYGVRGLGEVLHDRLEDDGWMVAAKFFDAGENPLDQIYRAADIVDDDAARRSVSALCKGLEPGSLTIVEGVKGTRWPGWKDFLGEYEAASRGVSRSDRPLILVIPEGIPVASLGRDCAALRIFLWKNVVGEFDVMLFVMDSLRNSGKKRARQRLIARIISRLSLWDVELAGRLLELDEGLLFDPFEALKEMVARSEENTLDRNWESGGLMAFDDVEMDHSFLLLQQSTASEMIRRRLWEAQASELLPFLEARRQYLSQQARPFLRTPIQLDGQSFQDVDELEIGQLAYLARIHGLRVSIKRAADTLRGYRNKLAHLEPLSYAEALDLLAGIENPDY